MKTFKDFYNKEKEVNTTTKAASYYVGNDISTQVVAEHYIDHLIAYAEKNEDKIKILNFNNSLNENLANSIGQAAAGVRNFAGDVAKNYHGNVNPAPSKEAKIEEMGKLLSRLSQLSQSIDPELKNVFDDILKSVIEYGKQVSQNQQGNQNQQNQQGNQNHTFMGQPAYSPGGNKNKTFMGQPAYNG